VVGGSGGFGRGAGWVVLFWGGRRGGLGGVGVGVRSQAPSLLLLRHLFPSPSVSRLIAPPVSPPILDLPPLFLFPLTPSAHRSLGVPSLFPPFSFAPAFFFSIRRLVRPPKKSSSLARPASSFPPCPRFSPFSQSFRRRFSERQSALGDHILPM